MGIGPLITAVTRHRVGANVLMLVFFLAGAWALTKLSTRFFPEFESNSVTTSVAMPGASATEIEEAVVVPLENALRNLDDLEELTSYSVDGSGRVIMEFPDGTDMARALKDIKAEVERVALPSDAKAPRTERHARPERVAKMSVATGNRAELYAIARRLEADLNAAGIAKVEVEGIPVEEIQVAIDERKLLETGLTLEEIGAALRAHNADASVGSFDGLGNQRKVRAAAETSDLNELYRIPVAGGPDGDTIHLRDIATITRGPAADQALFTHNGVPAVRFRFFNSGTNDIIATARELYAWHDRVRPTLPDSVILAFHDEDWKAVESRRTLLLENGMSGMLIVLGVLFVFLSLKVAIWVAVGIPAAMLATLFVFSLAGGTINMISMFALIMAVGIIVDDSIVVGENAQYRLQRGQPPMRAVTGAARTMFTPVFASSFTTIASFLPLFLIGGTIGSIIFDIPLIICCILVAALIECFLILPGHLYHSFSARRPAPPGRLRAALDHGFDTFRDKVFRPFVTFAVRHALATFTACLVVLALAVGLLANGFLKYRFFPGAERSEMTATIEFTSGTSRATMAAYVDRALAALDAAEAEVGGGMVEHVVAIYGRGADHKARIDVELVDPDARDMTTQQFSGVWRRLIGTPPAGLEKFSMRGPRHGPGGSDVQLRLTGGAIDTIKDASLRLQVALTDIGGITSVGDDTPFGEDELAFELTPLGRSLGLDIDTIARQLRHAIDGYLVQTFSEGVDEVELRVLYAEATGDVLRTTNIRVPGGEYVALGELVTWNQGRGFETILRRFGRPAITVTGDLEDDAGTNLDRLLAGLEAGILTELRDSHGISHTIEGQQEHHREATADMLVGLGLAVVLILIILTWVFNSWSLPLVVMVTMPLGIIGTLIGHWVMGLTMSILSIFGVFTLMGIIVNNSIVLVRCFLDLGPDFSNATDHAAKIVTAACLRLRAVLVTSLTTIGGLLPLMFETSLQAQFLIPMAASLVFGLAFATVLILVFTPATLALHGAIGRGCRRLLDARIGRRRPPPPFARPT